MAMATCGAEHPLLIDVVLETMFENVTDLSDLKSARQVCRSWRKCSLKQWRQVGVPVLLQSKKSNKKKRRGTIHPSTEELVSLMEEDGDNDDDNDNISGLELARRRYQGIRLNDWKFYGDRDGFLEETLFKEKLAPFLTYLHLDHCTFTSYSVLDELLARALPQLKKLVWSDSKLFRQDHMAEILDSVEMFVEHVKRNLSFQRSVKIFEIGGDSGGDLFRWNSFGLVSLLYGMPNLEELIIRIRQNNQNDQSQPRDAYYTDGLLHAIRIIRDLRNNADRSNNESGAANIANIHDDKFRLRNLDIMDFFPDATSEFPSGLTATNTIRGLQLERLAVDVGTTTSEQVANAIFSANPETLKELQAFRAPIRNVSFPYSTVPFSNQMLALEKLHLWGSFTINLAFLQYTPSLQTLVLKTDCYDKWHKLKSFLKKPGQYLVQYAVDLVEITLNTIRQQRGAPTQEALTVTTVEHLELDYNVSATSIPTLATWLPNVKTLKLVLNNESLEAVSRAWPQLAELELLFGSEVDDDGITYLQRFTSLKKFKSNAYCNKGLLSSSSVDRVFLKMKTLECLEICVSSKMSVEAEKGLAEAIAQVKVIRNYDLRPGHFHHSQECCERMKFRRESIKPTRGARNNN